MFGKINQRGITWKLRKGEQSFLCMTCHPDLIQIPIKLHEYILNSYLIMELTRMFTDGWTDARTDGQQNNHSTVGHVILT